MKKAYIYVLIAVALMACSLPATAQQSKGSQVLAGFSYPDINWSVPEVGTEVQRKELANGMIIYLMEDHRLPMLSINALIRCGDMYVPLEQMALPGIVGEVLRSGGTENITADSLNALLELIGARLETGIDSENGQASLSVMTKDTELGVRLLADVLRNPAFPEDKLELSKTQIKTDIKRRNDNPQSILSREFYNIIYGNHPEGRILEWKYVAPITRQNLIDYHREHFAPNGIMMGITGDFNTAEMMTLLDKYFGDWKRKDIASTTVPTVKDSPKPGVYQIHKDVNQTSIRFGELGVDRDNPDRFAISVMNYILGGGSFTSRMTSKVRSDEGLSYSVGTRFQTDSPDLGTWYAFCQTKSSTTHKAMRLMLDEVKRIQDGKVTDEELSSAKDSYINRYVFNFTSAGQIVSRLMELEFDNRPPDELKTYIGNIRKVTKDDVLRVAKKYLRLDNITFVVVGNPDNFEQPLDDFGTITDIELENPVLD